MLNKQILIELFIKTKLHLGSIRKSNQNVSYFILGYRQNQYIIDLNITYYTLKRSFYFIINNISKFQTILIVSEYNNLLKKFCLYETKKQAYYWCFEKWEPGFLTNFKKILLDFKDEMLKLEITSKQDFNLHDLKIRPKILLIFNAMKYKEIIEEAYKLKMPIIAIVDTNCTPDLLMKITYAIPGNTNSLRSIYLLSKIFIQAIILGQMKYFLKKNNFSKMKLFYKEQAKQKYGFYKTNKK